MSSLSSASALCLRTRPRVSSRQSRSRRRNALLLVLGGLACATPPSSLSAGEPVAKFSSSVVLRETYDTNVYLQRVTPRANHDSFVSTLIPSAALDWKPAGALSLAASYTPEIAIYHSASSESHVAHKLTATFSGTRQDAKWDLATTFAATDGDAAGPVYTGPGGSAILAGVPLFERRDQHVLRQNFKLHLPRDAWFARPVATTYFHDFHTDLRTTPGYQNYIDRSEVAAGLDLGRKVSPDATLFTGFRYGTQHQAASPVSAFEYDNYFRRWIAGAEASLATWLKLNVSAGPESRSFGSRVPPNFARGRTRLFLDASLTATPDKTNTASLAAKRFALPGYGGGSFLEITAFDATWKRTLNATWSAALAARVHRWEFALPVVRDERWHGVNLTMTGKLAARTSFTAGLALDRIRSDVPNTAGREASRRLFTVGLTQSL